MCPILSSNLIACQNEYASSEWYQTGITKQILIVLKLFKDTLTGVYLLDILVI